ncbi:MAG: tail fiber domain-containing protein [Pyrinomonadaceae bacterium]
MNLKSIRFLLMFAIAVASVTSIKAQTTSFSFQGSLNDGAASADGAYDFEFRLFDANTGGNQLGATATLNSIAVAQGVFSVSLDFGSQFDGSPRFLEISLRPAGQGAFTTLSPRQAILSNPYAIRSSTAANADTATNAQSLGGVAASEFVVTTDSRLTDARAPLPNSPDYIRNNTSTMQPANFTINGTGSASVFLAFDEYRLGNSRVLSIAGSGNTLVGSGAGVINNGTQNTFTGTSAGVSNINGSRNSFFGFHSGNSNVDASDNSFFGHLAGQTNTTGIENSFFGGLTGRLNQGGSQNSFYGYSAGQFNNTGDSNSFFGNRAGNLNSTGSANSFFGAFSGSAVTLGANNAFFGRSSGSVTSTGSNNTAIGSNAGGVNTTGSDNTYIGANTEASSNALSFATAIGAGAVVGANNTVQIGRSGIDKIRIGTLSTGGDVQVCMNSATNELAACSSSARYKSEIRIYSEGLSVIQKLAPVSFSWRNTGRIDVGFVAEDVAKAEPLFASKNENGEVEGVRYDRITTALVNAVKELQIRIDKLAASNTGDSDLKELVAKQMDLIRLLGIKSEQQQAEIEALKNAVCKLAPETQGCASQQTTQSVKTN